MLTPVAQTLQYTGREGQYFHKLLFQGRIWSICYCAFEGKGPWSRNHELDLHQCHVRTIQAWINSPRRHTRGSMVLLHRHVTILRLCENVSITGFRAGSGFWSYQSLFVLASLSARVLACHLRPPSCRSKRSDTTVGRILHFVTNRLRGISIYLCNICDHAIIFLWVLYTYFNFYCRSPLVI